MRSNTADSDVLYSLHRQRGDENEEACSLIESGQGRIATQVPSEAEGYREKDRLRQWNLLQCLMSFDYWALWLAEFIGIGSGFTFLNNLGQSFNPFLPTMHTLEGKKHLPHFWLKLSCLA